MAGPVGLLYDLASECICQLPARSCPLPPHPTPCICVCLFCLYACVYFVCRGLTSWLVCCLQHLSTKLCLSCVRKFLCPPVAL